MVPDHAGALFCAVRATGTARSDIEWARARNIDGVAHVHLGKPDEALAAFTATAERFATSIDTGQQVWQATALFNKGFTLGVLGRGEAEIAAYDDLLVRFGTAAELPLRELVAKARSHKKLLRKS